MSRRRPAAASTWAARRSRRSSSTPTTRCSAKPGARRRRRRPAGRRRRDGRGDGRGRRSGRDGDRRPARGRSRLPGRDRADRRDRLHAKNLPDWYGSFPLGPRLKEALGTKVAVGNDVSVATVPRPSSAPAATTRRCSASSGGPASAAGSSSNGEAWHGRGSAGEIGHMVVRRGGARCPCGNRGCMEAYAGRAAMEAEARRRSQEGREDAPLQADEGAREAAADQRDLGAGAPTTATRWPRS